MRSKWAILMLLVSFTVEAQQIDSLKDELEKFTGFDRIPVLHQLIYATWLNATDEALEYANEAVIISERAKDMPALSKSYRLLSGVYVYRSELETGLGYVFKSLDIAMELQDSALISTSYNNTGHVYLKLGNYHDALEYSLRSIDIKEKFGLLPNLATTYNNVGRIYFEISSFEKARAYFNLAYSNAKEYNNRNQILYTLNNIGYSYLLEKKTLKALEFLRKASKESETLDNKNWESVTQRGHARAYLQWQQYDTALMFLERSIALSEQIEDKIGLGDCYYWKSQLFREQNELPAALSYLDMSHNFAVEIGARKQILRNLQLYAMIHQDMRNRKMLETYQKQYIAFTDSIHLLTSSRNLDLIPIKLNHEEAKLELLRNQLALERTSLINRQYIIVIAVSVSLLVVVLVFYLKYLKANKLLSEKNRAIQQTLNELKSTQSMLVQSEKMASLGIMSAGVGHELNNPLNYIRGGAAALKSHMEDNYADEEIDQMIEVIDNGIDRVSTIIKVLDDFSSDSNDLSQKCEINQIIDNCIKVLQRRMNGKVEVKRAFGASNIVVYGNKGRLHQVFLNILANAEQAIEDQGKITISTSNGGNSVTVKIKDTGVGISETQLSHIFDPFYTTKDPGQGVGLGLAITYQIIREHGGQMKVNSNPGEGTEVIIKIPVND